MSPANVSSLLSGNIDNEAVLAYSSAAGATRTYSLDTADNWTNVEGQGFSYVPSPDKANAYQNVPDGTASYDDEGRQITAGAKTFSYDVWGHLARVSAPGLDCTYGYDGAGRRIREICNDKVVHFAYDGENLVGETQDGKTTITVHQGEINSPLVRIGSDSITYLALGADRSVRATLDRSGKVLERYAYSAYGETSVTGTSTGNRFGYQGSIYDPGTGLYYMRARYYAPAWGRFWSRSDGLCGRDEPVRFRRQPARR